MVLAIMKGDAIERTDANYQDAKDLAEQNARSAKWLYAIQKKETVLPDFTAFHNRHTHDVANCLLTIFYIINT